MCKRRIHLFLLMLVLGLALASQAQVKDASLLAYWRLDESSGTTAVDASGNGNNGALYAGAAWTAGVSKGGLYLDGVDDYMEVPVAVPEQGTIGFWFKPDWNGTDPDDYRIFDASMGGIYFFLSKGANEANITQGEIGFYFEDSTDADYQDIEFDPDNDVFAGTWFHLAATWDFGGGSAVLYFNGQEVARRDNLGPFPNLDPNPHFGFQTYAYQPQTHGATGTIDEIMMFNRVLSAAEIPSLMVTAPAELASGPKPADEAVDVPRDVVLSWTAGEAAAMHDVYFGTTRADVNDADRANPMGALVSEGQADAALDPEGLLEYGQTYYWRIDEVNAAPDNTIFTGEVWSFTVEPFSYPVTPSAATASTTRVGMGPENTINGSGLNANDEHSTELTQMWMSTGAKPEWIQYEFANVYKLDKLWVWNSNQLIESFVGFGAKDVTIEYSVDGAMWTALEGVPEFAQATALPGYRANTVVDLGGVMAKFVKLTINANWGGVAPQTGLSEVRFFHIPVQAFAPQPAADAVDVDVATDLNWRPGREAESHQVYLGTDPAALAEVGAPAGHSYTPVTLDFGTVYFWKVDEVGGSGPYEGELWSFITQEYATIDDFETYNDDDNRVYDAWIDGLTTGASGSQVGYDISPFAERKTVHGGAQAMPLIYDNSASPFLSEAERTFATPQNWTVSAADTLSLYIQGSMPAFVETASGSILMNAIGTDIWDVADQFRFAYKTLNGNGTMVARVDSIFNSNAWAKGGVMIRQGIEPGSTHAFMPITPGGAGGGNGASFQRRLLANQASTNNDSTTVVGPPYWVKIERNGNNFTGSISPDGKTWTQLGTAQTIAMTGPVLIGLALCSHDAAIATGAEFSNVAFTGNVTGAWQIAEIGAAQPAGNSMEGLYVTIKDSSGKSATVANPDTAATVRGGWTQWKIPLSDFSSAGVKINAVKSIVIGVGNKSAPVKGGTGTLFIDDVGFGRPIP